MIRWRESRTILIQSSLLVACCLLAVWTRRIVSAEILGDLAAVSLEFGALALFMAAIGYALLVAYRAHGGVGRIALRLVPLALVIAAAVFAKASYADVSISLYALTSRGDDDGAAKIEIGPGGRDIRLTGSLTEGTGRQFAALLDSHPDVVRIHLTSDGGLVDEGDTLRKVIAAHRLTTFVPDYCVSACTLAFLGGTDRLVMTGARLGFHAPFEQGLFGQVFAGDKRAERATYISAGVAPDFVDKALAVAPADIWTPEIDDLSKAKVITGVVDRFRFPDSNLDGVATIAGARATVLRNFPAAKVLDTFRRDDVDAIAAAYLAAYRDGLSEGEVTDGLKAVIGAAAEAAIIDGDDETIVRYGRFLKQAMDAAPSEADCATIGRGADLLQAEEVLDEEDGQGESLAVALLTRALQSHHDGAGAFHAKVEAAPRPMPDQRSCAAVQSFYQYALGLPRHDAARVIRSIARRQAALSSDVSTRTN